jgi:drug/metabolite transporter (DMT)-like permease
MTSLAIGLGLALVASLALNGSYVIQHVGAVAAPPIDVRRPLATLAGLLRSRVWLAGAALGMTGWAVHVTALAHAPLSLVQAFVAGGLALVAPLAARALGHPMSRAEWTGVAVALFALALLCVGLRAPNPRGDVPAGAMAAFLAASAAAAAAFTRARPAWRAHALGLAGGVLYGAADVAIKGLTSVAHAHGAAAVAASPWLAAAALATAGAFFAFQRGLQTGRPVPTIVLMTAATTVVSILGGIAVFGDSLGASSTLVAVHLAAFVLVTVAAAALAPRAAPAGA